VAIIAQTTRFVRDLKKIPVGRKREVNGDIELFVKNNEDPPKSLKDQKLVNQRLIMPHDGELRCFRAGNDYRVIYDRYDNKIIFLNVMIRKDAYRKK